MDWGRSLTRGVRALMLASVLVFAVSSAAGAAPITEFSSGLPTGSDPSSLTAGPDGNVWFVDVGAIGRITPTGQITEFTSGLNPGSMPHAIAAGPDGNLWFTDSGTTKAIGKIAPSGQINETTTGLNPGAAPYELTAAVNGTLWFTDLGTTPAIGRIIPSNGAIKEFKYTSDPVPSLDEITGGPDGSVYFTDKGNNPGVGVVTPGGTVTEAPTSAGSMPSGIGGGPDGNVWFSDQGSPAIGRITPARLVTEFSHANGLQTPSAPDEITAGPDGNVWFDDQQAGSNAVGRVTPAGAITEFATAGTPWKIVDGMDGNLWLLQSQPEAILRITPTGSSTAFNMTAGLSPGANLIDTDITEGPDGNVWFVDKGAPTAIARADVQLAPTASTGAASSIGTFKASVAGTVNPRGARTTVSFQYGGSTVLGSTVSAGTLAASPTASPVSATLAALPSASTVYYRVVASSAYGTVTGAIQTFRTGAVTPITNPRRPTAASRTIRAILGNRRITLVIGPAAACTGRGQRLKLALSASTIARSRAVRLRFVSAALYLDRGVRHVRMRRVRGHRRRVVIYTANATVHKLPARRSLRLAGLRSGRHNLKVKLRFEKRKHVPARRTLSVRFRVC